MRKSEGKESRRFLGNKYLTNKTKEKNTTNNSTQNLMYFFFFEKG